MITMEVCVSNDPRNKFLELPSIDPNPTFLNASTSVVLQYNKRSGFHVKAKKDISQGEVIFVEKAYAFSPNYENGKMSLKTYCQYCTSQTTGCIPCKYCVKYIYCSEKCRDSAWAEFHRWECFGVQSGLLPQFYIGNLALRIVLKASHTGISTDTIGFNDGTIKSYGNENDNYPYVYNLPNSLGKLPKEKRMKYVATAALIIHYLKLKTDFLDYLKTKPAYTNKKDKEVMNKLGGIMLRHIAHFERNAVAVKAVDIHSNQPNDVFLTVCPSMALMAHSCDPNTSYFFIGDTVVVKAMKNIKSNEELVRSYMNLTYRQASHKIRQRILLETFFINCRCEACTNPKMDGDLWNSYVCRKCKGPAICSEELAVIFARRTCICLDCNYKFILSDNMMKLEVLSNELLLKFELQGNTDDAIHGLKISKTIFQPKHPIFQKLYWSLLEHYLNKDDLKNYIEIGSERNNLYKLMYTEVAFEYGMVQYQYCLNLMKLVEGSAINVGLSHLRDALKALTVSVNETKTVFSLHYPQFLVYLQEVEEKISKIRILHAIRIANAALLNM